MIEPNETEKRAKCAPSILADRPASETAREREERLLADEALGAGRDERDHLVPGLDEEARQLARLVGRNAAGDAQEDTAHAQSVPETRRPRHEPGSGYAGSQVRTDYFLG